MACVLIQIVFTQIVDKVMPRRKKFKGDDGHPTHGELKICHSRGITYEQYKKEQKKEKPKAYIKIMSVNNKTGKLKPYDMNNCFPKVTTKKKKEPTNKVVTSGMVTTNCLVTTTQITSQFMGGVLPIVLTEENIKKEVKKIKQKPLDNITEEFLNKYAPKKKEIKPKEPLKRNIIL